MLLGLPNNTNCLNKTLQTKTRIFLKILGFLVQLAVPLRPLLKKRAFFFINSLIVNMFAIVSIAGQQFKVEEGQEIFVHRLAANEDDALTFGDVHLIENDGSVRIGTPHVSGASIKAKVLGHVKGDKVIVFKKKRRKGYRVKNGHRQSFTKIQIESIQG